MAVKKDRIVFGDTYHISYTCLKRDGTMKMNDRQPISPIMAEISLWNVIDQVFVPLNEHGDLEMSVVPIGNKIDFIIPADVLAVDGDYKAFVTAIFDVNGTEHRVTQIRAFRVQAKE